MRKSRWERQGLPVTFTGVYPEHVNLTPAGAINYIHKFIPSSTDTNEQDDDLLLVAYRDDDDTSVIKFKVIELETGPFPFNSSCARYRRQQLLDAMGTFGSRGVLTPDMIALLESLQKDENGKRYWANWAMALGLPLAASDAIWQAGCFMLGSMTGDAEHGLIGMTVEEYMIFGFPVGLAMLSGLLFYWLLLQQYRSANDLSFVNDNVPDHIKQACAKQGRQLMVKMFAAVSTFTLMDYVLEEFALDWLNKHIATDNLGFDFHEMNGNSPLGYIPLPGEMALVLSLIIGAAAALAVVGTAMAQDKMDHGKLTAGASFYLALAASVIAGVVFWCFMAYLGADLRVTDALGTNGAQYGLATFGTLLLVALSFRALPAFQDGYDKAFAIPAKTHLALMAGFAVIAVTCAIVGFSLATFPMDMGGSDYNLLDSIFSSGLDKAVQDPSAGESAGLGVASVVSFFGMGAGGYAANKQYQAAKEEISNSKGFSPA